MREAVPVKVVSEVPRLSVKVPVTARVLFDVPLKAHIELSRVRTRVEFALTTGVQLWRANVVVLPPDVVRSTVNKDELAPLVEIELTTKLRTEIFHPSD